MCLLQQHHTLFTLAWPLYKLIRLLHRRRKVLPMVCKDWAAASAVPSELWRQASSVYCALASDDCAMVVSPVGSNTVARTAKPVVSWDRVDSDSIRTARH